MSLWSDKMRRQFFETYQRGPGESSEQSSLHRSSSGNVKTARRARKIFLNFLCMSLLFSAHHGCVVACLSLATARLGSTGSWQSGVLYISYSLSALLGATCVSKCLGPRNALIAGMALYCFYVGSFWWATQGVHKVATLIGAAIGGIGAGIIWTAQGTFFAQAAEEHARALAQPTTDSTAKLAGAFAFLYLAFEVSLRSLSSVLFQTVHAEWSTVFGIYFLVAVFSTFLMGLVELPKNNYEDNDLTDAYGEEEDEEDSTWTNVTSTFNLLLRDRKMQYMIGLNAVFGFASAFINSYVNGEVARVVLNDNDSKYVGFLTAWATVVAAVMSLLFSRLVHHKGMVLTIGAICFLLVALPFMVIHHHWNIASLIIVYTLHGTGRATFEGTLKATFADFFPQDKEGAFANIILQNGLASAFGFVISNLKCTPTTSTSCVQFQDGTYHNVSVLEWLIVGSAVAAIVGYWRADKMHRSFLQDEQMRRPSVWTLVESGNSGTYST